MKIRSKRIWNSGSKKFETGLLEFTKSKIKSIKWGRECLGQKVDRDFDDLCIGPAAIDLHVHSRDFEESHKETFESLEAGAFAGGVASMACMANTRPRLDEVQRVKNFLQKAKKAHVDIRCFAAVTKNLEGQKPTDWDALLKLPILGLSDDGKPILDDKIMESVLRVCKKTKRLLSVHEEDTNISCGSVLHKSAQSTRYGIEGSSEDSESKMVARDLALAEKLKAHIHFCHISSAQSVDLFRRYHKRVSFSAEITPHHALLEVGFFERMSELKKPLFKVCPVIRSEADRKSLLSGLKQGLIDCFASDHAPHSWLEKEMPIGLAAHGIISLEYFYPLYLEVRRESKMSWSSFFSAISERPAELMGLSKEKGRIQEGYEASFVVFDPEEVSQIQFSRSKSKNSPLEGRSIHGKIVEHWVKGSRVYVT